jgi:hypothetical protein
VASIRIYSLTPGEYFVRATVCQSHLAEDRRSSVNPNAAPARAGYLPMYFSNATDISSAGMISLKAGETVDRVDLRLAPASTVNIRGTVMDSRTGKPARFFCKCKAQIRNGVRPHLILIRRNGKVRISRSA